MKHKEAIEILQSELNISEHFSSYPQDRYKNEKPQPIKVLLTTSEYHKKRVVKLKSAIEVLVNN